MSTNRCVLVFAFDQASIWVVSQSLYHSHDHLRGHSRGRSRYHWEWAWLVKVAQGCWWPMICGQTALLPWLRRRANKQLLDPIEVAGCLSLTVGRMRLVAQAKIGGRVCLWANTREMNARMSCVSAEMPDCCNWKSGCSLRLLVI